MEQLPFYTYYYNFPGGRCAYIGMGTVANNRAEGLKNKDFEQYRSATGCSPTIDRFFATALEAKKREAEMIEDHAPFFNIQRGLSKLKWGPETDNETALAPFQCAMFQAKGRDSVTPQAFCDMLPRVSHDTAIMLAGDRFSAMLKTFHENNPDHTGQIITVGKLDSTQYIHLGKAMEGSTMDNIEPENKDFLSTPLPQVDYVFANPPFGDNQWKAFLLKARSLARIGVFMLIPQTKPENIGVEHTVLIPQVVFPTASRFGMAIYVAKEAAPLKREKVQCKWDVNIYVSECRQQVREVIPGTPFFGISRQKRIEKDFGIRQPQDLTVDETSVWIITGKDLHVLSPLLIAAQEKLYDYKTSILKAKGGKQISFSKQELITFLNTL